MADFLLELFSEEIPARMQRQAAADLAKLFKAALGEAGVTAAAVETFVTPRRLALIAHGLPLATAALSEERRGPRTDAPAQAIDGFLKSTGLTRDQLEEREDPKGRFLYAVIERPGQATAAVIAGVVPDIVRTFPWPKSMRWGSGSLRWVRPLHGIVALLDGDVIPLEIDGIRSGRTTKGHRFLSSGPIEIGSAATYADQLRAAHVILSSQDRAALIKQRAEAAAEVAGLALIADDGLLIENAGLTEWPVPLLGAFDPAFLDVPPEVIRLTMRTNQKYFACSNAGGTLAPAFVCVANIEASDGGAAIVAGNQKVLAARLADARFFWEQDKKSTLESRLPKLQDIVFHEKLGTVADRAQRLQALCADIEGHFSLGVFNTASTAAKLCKSDLVSGMVGEFPELQGTMGRYYADLEKLPAAVGLAIQEHYQPVGPADECPSDPTSVVVALADKIDALVGFFGIDAKPTGSKDPFALRRAALGVIRLTVENGLRLPFSSLLPASTQLFWNQGFGVKNQTAELIDFFADRLKVQQREAGVRHDLIDAVFALGGEDDLVRLLARVKALQAFVATEDGTNLLAGYKRAANILRIEEKKDARAYDGAVAGLAVPEEVALGASLDRVVADAEAAVAHEDFEAAMGSLATLRPVVDAFFEKVTVNDTDPAVRENRLNLLNRFRVAVHKVADFSRIEG